MFKLYARKGAGSAAVEAVLALSGASFAIEDVARQADGTIPASYRKINPRGEVPTLILPDGGVMTESAAMAIYLADAFPEARLGPGIGDAERPAFLRWLIYLATTIYMSDLRMYYPARYSTDPAAAPGIKARAIEAMDGEFAVLAEALGQRPYFLGDTLSALDIYAAMLCTWVIDMNALLARHPNLKAMYDRVTAVPQVAKVWDRNGM